MDAEARAELERSIAAHCEAGRHAQAATAALQGYGPEVLGYLAAMTRSESDAAEVFSSFCEDLWKGLPNFRWASSFRTWAYTLARHALYRSVRSPAKARDWVPLSNEPDVFEIAERVRTTTMIHLRTEVKDRVAALRDQLDPDDRTLLILRIDRQMAWTSIARILGDAELGEAEVKRIAATLRKRFERVKERLRRLAQAEGLLAGDD